MKRMTDFIRAIELEPEFPAFLMSFAKAVSGGKSNDDDDIDDDIDDEDEDDIDDEDADKTDEELREELKKTRASLAKANGQSAKRRKALREREAELVEARKPRGKKTDEDDVDLDSIRHEAKTEGERAGVTRAKKAEAKAALLAAGVNPERVTKATGLLDLDELDLDDDGLDGIDDAIDDLRASWPELFARQRRQRRDSVAGDRDRDGKGSPGGKPKTASERAAAMLLGRG